MMSFGVPTKERGEIPARVLALLGAFPKGAGYRWFGVNHEDVYEGEPGVDRTRYEILDTASSVHLPLSGDQWMSMAQRGGPDYIGGCCGNLSAAQDIMNGVFRDDGWIDGNDFLTIGQYVGGHDGFEEDFADFSDEEFDKHLATIVRLID